jgi:hypothetical protein
MSSVSINGVPIEEVEDDWDRPEPDRKEAMAKWHKNHREVGSTSPSQSGVSHIVGTPRKCKHRGRTVR